MSCVSLLLFNVFVKFGIGCRFLNLVNFCLLMLLSIVISRLCGLFWCIVELLFIGIVMCGLFLLLKL